MIVIRAAQMDELRRASLDRYAESLAREVVRADAELKSHPDARGVARRAVKKAWDWNLRQHRELRTFVELALHLGEYFWCYPPFRAILTGEATGERSKLEELFAKSKPKHWMAAAEMSRALSSRKGNGDGQ